jgi:putative DNA primase/helicase
MFKKEISALKAFITSDEDILRLPYERKSEKYPRRTIMCATVNDPNFLNDPTGSSRFWVITAKSIRYNHGIDISQLWAQALKLYSDGVSWWLEGEEKDWLTVSNANFYELDAHAELIKIKFDLDALNGPV